MTNSTEAAVILAALGLALLFIGGMTISMGFDSLGIDSEANKKENALRDKWLVRLLIVVAILLVPAIITLFTTFFIG